MSWLVAVGAAWLLLAVGVSLVIGRAIGLADREAAKAAASLSLPRIRGAASRRSGSLIVHRTVLPPVPLRIPRARQQPDDTPMPEGSTTPSPT